MCPLKFFHNIGWNMTRIRKGSNILTLLGLWNMKPVNPHLGSKTLPPNVGWKPVSRRDSTFPLVTRTAALEKGLNSEFPTQLGGKSRGKRNPSKTVLSPQDIGGLKRTHEKIALPWRRVLRAHQGGLPQYFVPPGSISQGVGDGTPSFLPKTSPV